ncbi:uncharacterized protein THITE_2113751 [Thermothielavioides terrestris NRRL 8126]|uniref:Ecp2 effector protein domain-containing protein n=1 Tax=Thermothielavioides terrestris (strain ATCC 38088 / NRRL 8126) TaxID=578455 RepID=G2R475_THETT|nr:uncharacterized protein THITE_2113751 [Thermothielavioides terrestris NRRL 8126]AEO66022.1 hypothetical protein THITE_2113751 [Thermothielavioides terrestris NRRL 8126]
MLSRALLLLQTFLAFTSPSLAAPSTPWYVEYHQPRVAVPQSYYEGLGLLRQAPLNPNAVRDVVCLDPSVRIVEYDQHAAMLAICDGIAGPSISACGGAPASTVGRSGRAAFAVRAAQDGARITLSKDRWVGCVGAARRACPAGSFEAVCVGGATRGDVVFSLTAV